jgi:hypothetical protein
MRRPFLASDQHGRHDPCIEHMRPWPRVVIEFLHEQPFFGAPERAISYVLMNFPGCEIDIIKLVIDRVSFNRAQEMRFPKKTRFPRVHPNRFPSVITARAWHIIHFVFYKVFIGLFWQKVTIEFAHLAPEPEAVPCRFFLAHYRYRIGPAIF